MNLPRQLKASWPMFVAGNVVLFGTLFVSLRVLAHLGVTGIDRHAAAAVIAFAALIALWVVEARFHSRPRRDREPE
jgi:hypothetical protein